MTIKRNLLQPAESMLRPEPGRGDGRYPRRSTSCRSDSLLCTARVWTSWLPNHLSWFAWLLSVKGEVKWPLPVRATPEKSRRQRASVNRLVETKSSPGGGSAGGANGRRSGSRTSRRGSVCRGEPFTSVCQPACGSKGKNIKVLNPTATKQLWL